MSPVTASALVSIIASGEGQSVEFKDERIKPADLAETLVAFANAKGGTVLIGVSDDGSQIGVDDPKGAIDNVLIAASRECCDPPVILARIDEVVVAANKTVLVIRVQEARTTVHSVHGRFLQRQGSRNVALTSAAIRQILGSRDGLGSLPVVPASRQKPSVHSQMYEILTYTVTLTLLDKEGNQAILERQERVRFLQNNVIALYDHAWGDGQLFTGYRVAPGRVADRFKVGSRYHTLISLRDTKHCGDVLNYRVRRRIVQGFANKDEWLEAEVDHATHKLKLCVIFPADRVCQAASVIQAGTNKRILLTGRSFRQKSDGRQFLTWTVNKPPLGERYALHWEW